MKKVISLTNNYIIIATPLLLFLCFLSIYLFMVMRSNRPISIIIGILLTMIMLVAFGAGWGNMLKSAVTEKNQITPYMIIKDFAPGIGEYILPTGGLFLLTALINFIVLYITYTVGMHFIGDIGISAQALSDATANNEALKAFLMSLSMEQLTKLNLWNLLILTVMSITAFLLLFCYPAIFFTSKNPLKALWLSIKNMFTKKLLASAGIYILIFSLNFFISVLSAVFSGNTVISFVMTLVNFYFVCCVAVGIFYFYYKNFSDLHLGNNLDTYI